MKLKWYITGLILFSIALACNWNPTHIPNQEILLQVNDANGKDEQSQITQLKQSLLAYGITEIETSQTKEGNFKITYFSDLDAAVIEALLVSKNYAFKVFNINPQKKPLTGVKGNLVVKQKSEADRFTSSNQISGFIQANETSNHLEYAIVYNDYYHNQVDKNTSSYNIPEVRAGPIKL